MSNFSDWSKKAKKVINKPFGIDFRHLKHEHEITDELFEECYKTAARIVKKYGEVYLPIFERMHTERQKRKKNKNLIEQAINVADT